MEVDKPIWHLKIVCPCCRQGHPMLISCPECGYVAAACEEVGNNFLDPQDLIASVCASDITNCPGCGRPTLKEFVPATSQQIHEAGLEGLYDWPWTDAGATAHAISPP